MKQMVAVFSIIGLFVAEATQADIIASRSICQTYTSNKADNLRRAAGIKSAQEQLSHVKRLIEFQKLLSLEFRNQTRSSDARRVLIDEYSKAVQESAQSFFASKSLRDAAAMIQMHLSQLKAHQSDQREVQKIIDGPNMLGDEIKLSYENATKNLSDYQMAFELGTMNERESFERYCGSVRTLTSKEKFRLVSELGCPVCSAR